ncbi:MAG: tyramine oxidase subunit B [Arachnia sp.]
MSDSKITLRYLSEPEAIEAGVTDMAGCVDAMEEMFQCLGVGDYRMAGPEGNSHGAMVTFPEESPFPNMPVDGPDRRFMAMPAYLGGPFAKAGVKWYGSNINNRDKNQPRSILMFTLNDHDTGAPLMIMSANLLSAYRTGAVPGVGARYLAKPESEVAAIIGPGPMGKTGLEAFLVACPHLSTVRVAGRSQSGIDAFLDWCNKTYPQLDVVACSSIEEAVAGADVVHVGTSGPAGSANYPYVQGSWLKPGAFVSCVGIVKFDEEFLINEAYNALDYTGLYKAWAEEYPSPTFEVIGLSGVQVWDLVRAGKIAESSVVDATDLVLGRATSQPSPDQVRVFGVGGMPIEDVAWATYVYRNAVAKDIGTNLLLWDTPEMF